MSLRHQIVIASLVCWLTACPVMNVGFRADSNAGNSTDLLSSPVSPLTTASELSLYQFTPGTPVDGVSFSILNQPSWAQFDPATGKLYGYPSFGDFPNISIIATRGSERQTVGPFTISVNGDPFAYQVWGYENTGQKSYSQSSGLVGADGKVTPVHRLGIFGEGVRVVVSDTGMQIAHEDLAANVVAGASRDYVTHATQPYEGDPGVDDEVDPATGFPYGDHGTQVGGLIAAVGWNGKGSRGIAPKANLVAFNFLRSSQQQAILLDQITDPLAAVFNQSWGYEAPEYAFIDPHYEDHLRTTLPVARGGKGQTLVRSAGNAFQYNYPAGTTRKLSLNSNSSGYNALPYQMVVGAFNADGKHASYSSAGSNLWLSAPAGFDGKTRPATITTDLMGCSAGASRSTATINYFQIGQLGNTQCNYTSGFNGTSAAAPFVSGVVALMLEANPSLTWRDVKHILATTATRIDPNASDLILLADPAGHVNMPAWRQNAAGYWFHMWYGFGSVNAEAAVQMAKTYSVDLGTYQETVDSNDNWIYDTGPSDLAMDITDFDANGVSSQLVVTDMLTVEMVQISVMITHPFIGDIGLELVSPSGTRSVVMHTNNALYTTDFGMLSYLTDPTTPIQYSGALMLTNAFYGEQAAGTWKLNVIDGAVSNVGKLNRWAINIGGH